MMKGEGFCVQHQAWVEAGRIGGVDLIAKNRVTNRQHVDTKLVAATGARREADTRLSGGPINDLPIGLGGAAISSDLLTGAIVPIAAEGEVDPALVFANDPMHTGNVSLLRTPMFEFLPQKALRLLGARKQYGP